MKKFFHKNKLAFAILLIVIYVVGFSNADMISEFIGLAKSLTAAFGLIMSVVMYAFIRKNKLHAYTGLCTFQGDVRKHLYFFPLIVISCVNFINGVQMNETLPVTVLYMISMVFVGFLEEIIFRGFLFGAMQKDGLTWAVLVSSVTFGMGHIVNLLTGAPVLGTLLQLVYASAIGFLFTVLFLTGKSLLPCILSHIFINATSVFARPMSGTMDIIVAIVQTLLSIGYGIWLFKKAYTENTEKAKQP